MRRYIKYSKNYKIALISFAFILAASIAVSALAIVLYTSPTLESIGFMSRMDAIATLYLAVPAIIAAGLVSGMYFWFKAENRRHGLHPVDMDWDEKN
ncbi:MAG: hypothetical protein ACQCN4_07525 [Candidatus Bathyarchaeia archaeon]